MATEERVLDAGPIAFKNISLYGDADLEHGLRHAGFDPDTTAYRLIEIPLAAIGDTASMASWKHTSHGYVDALRAGVKFPPIVVMPTKNGWTLLDGVNRTYAAWVLGLPLMTAYELLDGSRVL